MKRPVRTSFFLPYRSPVRLPTPAALACALSLLLAPASSQAQVPVAVTRTAADPAAPLLQHGVSRELATTRFAAISDLRYDLSLDVTAPDSALGHVAIHFMRHGTGDVIVDFRGRRLTSLSANGTTLDASAFNGNHIRVPAKALLNTENALEFSFVTDIAANGASIIKTHDTDGSDYLYTLLVPADANQLFPCFDQPDLKARVTFHLRAPLEWNVIANGSIAKIETGAGTRTTHFTETRPLSTYLIAFAAGPWQRATSTVNGRTISVLVRRSRFKEADTDSILALNHRAITWMEQYFNRAYPFEKFDLLLAPAFPFGGMEHPGLVMYNENSFIFRDRPTLARRLGRFSTILHEVAHQWFGDLVTMKWFDDLWLKEGFATYMAAKAQYSLDSTTGAWKTFYQGNKPTAYGVDQTTGTNSLWQKLGNLDQAKSNYGPIVYNKAPSVLKQLNYLVGEEAFQSGVRSFLSTHAYANATWQDLLNAVGKAATKPGSTTPWTRTMDDFGTNFMLRPGMPIVEQHLTIKNGRIAALDLVQRPAQPLSGTGPWPMRTEVLLAYAGQPAVRIPVELRNRTTTVTAAIGKPAPQFVFANSNDYGYFLTILDSASVKALEDGALGTVQDPFLRTMLWGALWDQVRDAQYDPIRFARLALRELPREKDEQIFPNILGRMVRAATTYAADSAREMLRPRIEDALWAGANDAALPFGIRRAYIDAYIGVAKSDEALAHLTALLNADSVAGEPMRDPTRWSIVDRLTVIDYKDAPRLLATQILRDTTPDGRRRAFTAGAGRKNAEVKKDYFTRYFSDKTLNEDWASGSLGIFNSGDHAELTLPYLRPALDSLPYIQANRRIFFLGSWLGAFIGGHKSEAALKTVQQYLSDNPKLPLDLRQKVLQSADDLERTVKIRKRWSTARATSPAK